MSSSWICVLFPLRGQSSSLSSCMSIPACMPVCLLLCCCFIWFFNLTLPLYLPASASQANFGNEPSPKESLEKRKCMWRWFPVILPTQSSSDTLSRWGAWALSHSQCVLVKQELVGSEWLSGCEVSGSTQVRWLKPGSRPGCHVSIPPPPTSPSSSVLAAPSDSCSQRLQSTSQPHAVTPQSWGGWWQTQGEKLHSR